jgi:hypothetical protein
MAAGSVSASALRGLRSRRHLRVTVRGYATPSFFCRLVDEVVYWNTSRLSG